MAGRGRIPSTFDGIVQAPGMLRHGSFPGLGLAGHHPFEPLPHPELLENKMAVQAAEIERLIRENQRLASTHVALREELVAIQQEMQRVQAHMGSIQTESDIQMRSLLEKSAKMKADIRAGGSLRKDLQQAHVEAQSLIAARQELNTQIKQTTLELQKAHADAKKLPEMQAELDSLRQEHQKLRVAFEYEKGSNIDQVERMHAMERNLISLAREVEKLRTEVLNAEKKARGRAGRLDDAEKLVNSMPFCANSHIWWALLSACRAHGNVRLGRLAAGFLPETEPNNPAVYILLSNIHAAAGPWEEAVSVRELMKKNGVTKRPGYSWMESESHSMVKGSKCLSWL